MMIDIDYTDIDCPKCHFKNEILLKNIRLKDVIICRGCKKNIRLDDHMHRLRKVKRNIEKQLSELQNMLNFKL